MSTPSPWVVRFASRIRPGGTVLDVAAGGGRHTRYLRDLGHRVTAIDVDVSGLERFSSDPKVTVVQADLERSAWPLRGLEFDGIVVTNYLHRPLLTRLSDALAPGGVLIYETFGIGNEKYGRPSNPTYLLRKDELLEAFEERLDVIAYEHVDDPEPRPAVRQRICAVLSDESAEAPERHPDAGSGADSE